MAGNKYNVGPLSSSTGLQKVEQEAAESGEEEEEDVLEVRPSFFHFTTTSEQFYFIVLTIPHLHQYLCNYNQENFSLASSCEKVIT